MIEHPFPEVEPDITITPRPDAALTEILRVDLGSGFVPLHVGAETVWSFYDWPERQLTGVNWTRVVGILKVGGVECLEIIDRYREPPIEEAGEWTRGLWRVSDESLQYLQREYHDGKGGGMIEEVDATPEDLQLRVGDTWIGHEIYRCGSEARGEGEVHHGVVEGPFEVALGAGEMLCLRETWWSFAADGRGSTMAELYVAETGRSVYFRRFNGPAWRNYEQLAGNPEREHDSLIWRLWYECLPDIALVS